MSLASLFLPHVPDDRRARVAAAPDLEGSLAALVTAGRRAWPHIRVDQADLLAFLGERLPADAASDPASIRADELYLVCAYGLGAPGAGPALEGHAMAHVERALARIGTSPATIADIQQELRQRLVEMRAGGPSRAGYAGRGALDSWLCVSAVRAANRRREREGREQPLEEADADRIPAPDSDPELDHLRLTYRAEFQAAFRLALDALTVRERNVLRYHFVEGLTIDQLGGLYAVHRATAARWIERAREALCLRVRELLAERVSLSLESFQRALRLVASQLSVRLDLAPP